MLRSVTLRKVESIWQRIGGEAELCMMKQMSELRIESSCTTMRTKRGRRMLVQLRGGTASFQIKMERCQGAERKRSICKECNSHEVVLMSYVY